MTKEEKARIEARLIVLELAVRLLLLTAPEATRAAILEALADHAKTARQAEPHPLAEETQAAVMRLWPPPSTF